MNDISDNHTFPTDVQFTGEAPSHHTPPEIPDPNRLFFMEAMNTFHKYVLHMFEQFQDEIAGLNRRLQMVESLVDAHNHVAGDVEAELKRLREMTDEMDETLLHIQENTLIYRDPSEVDFSKDVLTITGKPPF